MTIKRATLYFGGATLLAAWLASAASVSFQWNEAPRRAAPALDPLAAGEHLAADVQSQARRLKQRMTTAAPQPVRNPFAFGAVRAPRPQPPIPEAVPTTAFVPAPPPEPMLNLIGIAEERREAGVMRTAMLMGDADQLMVVSVGDTVLGRYRVDAISADSIELADPSTSQVRRLSIQ